jgi:hypothetical protein
VNWGIWVNGNSDPTKWDFVAQFGNDGLGDEATQVLDAHSTAQPCTPGASFADQQFSMVFPASCIGSPPSIEVAAFTETLFPSVLGEHPMRCRPPRQYGLLRSDRHRVDFHVFDDEYHHHDGAPV